MTELQQHLSKVLNEQKIIISEIQELNSALIIKKEEFLKLQGVIEYLTNNGVTLENIDQDAEEIKK